MGRACRCRAPDAVADVKARLAGCAGIENIGEIVGIEASLFRDHDSLELQ